MSMKDEVLAAARAAAEREVDRECDESVPDCRIDLLIELDALAKDYEARAKAAKVELERVGAMVIEDFMAVGEQSRNRRGRTVYLRKEEWPKLNYAVPPGVEDESVLADAEASAKDRLVAALAGDPRTAFLVKPGYNTQSLRSWMLRECPVDDATMKRVIPDFLAESLTVSEQFKVAVRKS